MPENLLIDSWGQWYSYMPPSDLELAYGPSPLSDQGPPLASVADLYLIQKLNLPAANHSDTLNVTLHDVENALSVIVASMFWTLGHIPPTHRAVAGDAFRGIFRNGTLATNSLNDVPKSPGLLPGNATVTEIYVAVRLELSIVAVPIQHHLPDIAKFSVCQVSVGLAASMTLMVLSLLLQRGSTHDQDLPVDGTGILHVIWLYRNHPELETLLEQAEHPTEDNLRAAGMVRTRLVGPRIRKTRSVESF
ncbi:hypothetical protein FB451DRAFT_1400506 [Mycena latifolia]|nr:hypothetical protein FB451DRAFT_1400506 [Mycena latifolia]